jgi:pimeloyl-ACP methyl ester carboxylesterase
MIADRGDQTSGTIAVADVHDGRRRQSGLPPFAKPDIIGKVPPAPPAADLAAARARELEMWRALASPGYPEDDATLMRRIEQSMARAYYPAGLERQGAAALTAGDRRNALKSVNVPTVVLHGAEDPLVPVDASRDVAASIPGAELRVIPGMGPDTIIGAARYGGFARKLCWTL